MIERKLRFTSQNLERLHRCLERNRDNTIFFPCKNPHFALYIHYFFVPLHPKHQEQTLTRVDSPTEQ